ncbi:hypothetical protein JCM19296_46 [Nonlabens ulvanivorans]|uniref:Cyclic GMP-AMP synthase n=1 Tax=Nonlabens ulvanivorans TaxID=906888 RepID=A0A081D6C2_NONUL|nr:hypothetical protein [Nonlabens ulvanivorans]GAK74468.1 hypothetical protein JCM19296_46 [Nonlabens ulvanivorans]
MCNCNKLMLDYESKITVPAAKKKKIQDSKDVLRKRIVDYFKGNHPDYKPKFAIQGSYIMKTTIVTKDEECDLDDGVYFLRDVDVTATTLQKWVKNALDGATTEPVQHRSKCLRVDYKADYHIDFPVYIFPEDDDHPSIAIKDTGFEESDPKEVKDWYAKKKKRKYSIKQNSKGTERMVRS